MQYQIVELVTSSLPQIQQIFQFLQVKVSRLGIRSEIVLNEICRLLLCPMLYWEILKLKILFCRCSWCCRLQRPNCSGYQIAP